MTRRELIEEVNRNCRFSNKSGVEYIVKLIEDVITKALIQGETIKLNGFLKLGTKQSSPRKGKFKGKAWKSKSKVVAYAKVSPVINSKIQEYQDMDWLDRFALLSYEEQYDFVKEAQSQIDDEVK